MKHLTRTAALLSLLGASIAYGETAWRSGEPIPLAEGVLPGKLAVGLSSDPVGQVASESEAGPSIFTIASKWSEAPGLHRYRMLGREADGSPTFGHPEHLATPFKGAPPPGVVFQTEDGRVHGFFVAGKGVARLVLDEEGKRFVKSPAGDVVVEGTPGKAKRMGVRHNADGSLTLLLGYLDPTPNRPEDPGVKNWRDPNYRPFDGAGVYRGGWPGTTLYAVDLASVDAAPSGPARRVSATEHETWLDYGAIAAVDLGPGHEHDVITGSWFGNFLHYASPGTTNAEATPHRLVVDEDGIAIRSRSIRPSPMAYTNAQTGRLSDLIVGGEGALHYYRFTGAFDDRGAPIYADPTPVRERGGALYAGSLPVISTADWDGDGALDLIAGQSEGRILWFRNVGSTAAPAFADGEEIHAGGEPIFIQPGYNDVQGPQESRWGYVSPTVADWDGDGLLDIVTSSATAVHEVFLNRGTKTEPKLDRARPIYFKGLELHGTWRVRPAVAKLGDRMAYVALDDQDEFHLYWQIDPFNLEDGGKLTLEDGSTIRANFLHAGGTGRSKFTLTDWDGDGKTDLLVGTPRHGSVPNPDTGLPQSTGLKGAAVLFMKNVGSEEKPVFAFPVIFRHNGEPIHVGQHECSAAVWDAGTGDGPDLLIGMETGRVLYFQRSELEWSAVGKQE